MTDAIQFRYIYYMIYYYIIIYDIIIIFIYLWASVQLFFSFSGWISIAARWGCPESWRAAPEALGSAARQHRCAFQLAIRAPGNFHGLALWFHCELLPGVSFTTGPEGAATHWEQTLLFVDPASAGDEVNYRIHIYSMI